MKVALCFFGQPRHLNNPYTFLSHKYWIIDRYNADVFCHSWISGGEKKLEYSDWVDKKYHNSIELKNSSDIILNKYKPKKYLFESPKFFSLDDDSKNILKEKEKKYLEDWKGEFNWTKNNENNTLSQLYSISKSISLLQDEKYDWIILSRYDNYIYDFPNLYTLEKIYENKNVYVIEPMVKNLVNVEIVQLVTI